MTGAAVQAYTGPVASAPGDARVLPLVRWTLYVTVFLIPLEYPDRFPFEVSTIAGACFLLTTLLQPAACYRLVPWAIGAFAVYFGAEQVAFITQGPRYPGGLFLGEVA